MKRNSLLIGCGVAFAFSAQPVRAQITIKSQVLNDKITVLSPSEGSGNTTIFKGPGGVLLIDTMADSIANQLHEALAGLNSLDVRYIFNTHWHHNHTSGNIRFSDKATIFGVPEMPVRLAKPQTLKFIVQETFPALPETAWPNVIFPDSMKLRFNGEEIRAWHGRGHTDTDVIVYLTGQNMVFTGDLFRMGGAILCDLDGGGNMIGVSEALTGLVARVPKDATVIPGHGGFGKVSDIETYIAALNASIAWVRKESQGGRSLADIQAMTPPAGTELYMGKNKAKPIEALYRSIQERK